MAFEIKRFDELSLHQLYEILKLRFDVFVSEQNSIYEEHDRIDYKALHMFREQEPHIHSYLRLFKVDEKTASIGRVLVHPEYRKQNAGRKLVEEAIAYIDQNWQCNIDIGAQEYLEAFYQSFGFKRYGKPYDDEGIQHIKMLRSL